MNTDDGTHFEMADVQVLFSEIEHPRSLLNRHNGSKPSGARPSRRLLRKLLRMRAALAADI